MKEFIHPVYIDDNVNLDLPLTEPINKYCENCDVDWPVQISVKDLYATITRIPSKKGNIELAFWAKCPKCGQDILIQRIE